MLYLNILTAAVVVATFANAHGEHGEHGEHGAVSGQIGVSETNEQYAARHMASEHHIDSFDTKAFFHLHDLNRDGFWDKDEIEAVYGVHHPYAQKKSPDEKERQEQAGKIVVTVLKNVDKNRDGKISPEELQQAGLDALPNFKELGVEGHHYDVESEFFLHHEEIYHSTPDTQTDESYNHPEDIEHFAMHEGIEAEEEARERKFQGIPDDQPLDSGHDHDHADTHELDSHPPDEQQHPFQVEEKQFLIPPRETPPEKLPPEVKFQKAALEGRIKDEWGQGKEGYARPRTAADKMRKNLPYKLKFRRSWGDF